MRIALMTWFEYENYGTALQASALYYVLKSNFGDTDVINYRARKPYWAKPLNYKEIFLRKLKRRKQLQAYSSVERSQLFDDYIKEKITVTNRVNSYPELVALNEEYDVFVCGSDQIWTPNSGDLNYYLPFVNAPQKRIAYAPSFGVTQILDNRLRNAIAKELVEFDSLSSREIQGAEIVKQLSGRESTLVVDPTLLLTKEDWRCFLGIDIEDGISKSTSYILCYFLGDFRKYSESVEEISKKLGMPVKVIPIWKEQGDGGIDYEIGPKEFVELLLNASYVCTDSFHGVAFSTNFNIPFSVFRRFSDKDPKSQNSRIVSFLELTGLSSRLIDPGDTVDVQCDFRESNGKLCRMRDGSFKYLRNAMGGFNSSRIGAREKRRDADPIVLADFCSGCGTCAAVCPKNAVSIQLNRNGFLTYAINESLCIRCGKCITACPMISVRSPLMSEAKGLYSFKSADSQTLATSSSGGIGAVLAEMLLNQGKRVFGCKYDSGTKKAVHIEVNANCLNLIKGSKYIQSDSTESLKAIYESDGNVVFFGTPCQVAGADSLLTLKGVRNKAILVELICHGVPSQLVWERYLEDLNKKHKTGEHPQVEFRDKQCGWGTKKQITVRSENGQGVYSSFDDKDDFYAFFNNSLFNAQCCYECPFRERSCADIRIGDYWGARFESDHEGVSMVVALTDFGAALVNKCSELGKMNRYSVNEYWVSQYPFNFGIPLFWDDLASDMRDANKSLKEILREYARPFMQRNVLKKVKAFIFRAKQ